MVFSRHRPLSNLKSQQRKLKFFRQNLLLHKRLPIGNRAVFSIGIGIGLNILLSCQTAISIDSLSSLILCTCAAVIYQRYATFTPKSWLDLTFHHAASYQPIDQRAYKKLFDLVRIGTATPSDIESWIAAEDQLIKSRIERLYT